MSAASFDRDIRYQGTLRKSSRLAPPQHPFVLASGIDLPPFPGQKHGQPRIAPGQVHTLNASGHIFPEDQLDYSSEVSLRGGFGVSRANPHLLATLTPLRDEVTLPALSKRLYTLQAQMQCVAEAVQALSSLSTLANLSCLANLQITDSLSLPCNSLVINAAEHEHPHCPTGPDNGSIGNTSAGAGQQPWAACRAEDDVVVANGSADRRWLWCEETTGTVKLRREEDQSVQWCQSLAQHSGSTRERQHQGIEGTQSVFVTSNVAYMRPEDEGGYTRARQTEQQLDAAMQQ